MSIPITPRRTEPLLLPKLRTLFPDVTFNTIERNDLEPPFTEATLADSMQGMSTPISQAVRLWIGNGVLDGFLEDESLFGEFLRTPVSEGGVESLVVEPPHIVVEVGA